MAGLLLDLEATGLIGPSGTLPDTIHCICTEEIDTGIKKDFIGPQALVEFIEYCKGFTFFVAHNAVGYDIPVMKGKLGFKCTLSQVFDTLIYSKILNPDRPGDGTDGYVGNAPHSLKAWGIRFGFPKGDFEDFSKFTPEMLKYCRRDVDILRKLYFRVKREQARNNVSERSIRLEHIVQYHITQQGWNGFAIDADRTDALFNEVSTLATEREASILKNFKPMAKPFKEGHVITPKIKKDGTMSVVGLKFLEDDWVHARGPMTRVKWEPFSLASPKQVVERMNRLGWKPVDKTKGHIKALKEVNYRGLSPEAREEAKEKLEKFKVYGWKVNEKNLMTLPDTAPPEAKLIADYVMLTSRKKFIEMQVWPYIDDKGRVHGRVDPLGAGTHRMTHSNPNMANVPGVIKDKDGKILRGFEGRYGYDCRAIFTVSDPENYRLVGADASGLELRMLAHFMGDPEYAKAVLGDIHTVNQIAAGLETRAQAKTFIYGFLYGAGAAKIGEIVGGGYKEGQALKDKFLDGLPALKDLIETIQCDVRRDGYIKGLDGRIIYVRSMHAALNTLLQGNGSILCKHWLAHTMVGVSKYELDVRLVANSHDEFQAEVHKDHVDTYSRIVKTAIKKAERSLELIVPMDCDINVGLDWSQTH